MNNSNSSFVENYRFLARYNQWFNQHLYDACERLSDAERQRDRGAFFGSIQGSLNHIVWADMLWLRRFAEQGRFQSLEASLLELPPGSMHRTAITADWLTLRAKRERLDTAVCAWMDEMPSDFPGQIMRYHNTQGLPRQHPAWQALTHFFNHQTHHRGQVTTLLSQAGIDPGVTDLISLV